MEEKLNTPSHSRKTYMYILESSEKIRMMTVDERDVAASVNGNSKYPLDATLKKNKVTLTDLKKWEVQNIRLVEMMADKERVLHEFASDWLAELFKA